jgi:hypothetical protein
MCVEDLFKKIKINYLNKFLEDRERETHTDRMRSKVNVEEKRGELKNNEALNSIRSLS